MLRDEREEIRDQSEDDFVEIKPEIGRPPRPGGVWTGLYQVDMGKRHRRMLIPEKGKKVPVNIINNPGGNGISPSLH
jgi:hypothetical protein